MLDLFDSFLAHFDLGFSVSLIESEALFHQNLDLATNMIQKLFLQRGVGQTLLFNIHGDLFDLLYI